MVLMAGHDGCRPACKIRVDQTARDTTGGAGRALGERGEDAIHPFAFQLTDNVQADRIVRIVALRPDGTGRNNRRQREDRKSRLDHLFSPSTLSPNAGSSGVFLASGTFPVSADTASCRIACKAGRQPKRRADPPAKGIAGWS